MTDESNLTLERKSKLEEALRNSLQSYSSSSDHTKHNIGKASFESIRTSSSFSQHHRVQFDSKEHSTIEQDDPYDTSALNIDYSDDEDHQRPPQPIPTPTASTSSRLNRNIPQRASRPHQQAKKQKENNKEPSKDESEPSHLRVDEYGFILQPDQLAATSRLSTR
jgi:hypothetical protein